MAGVFLFDYSKISAGEYGHYVFKKIVAALSGSRGACCFNDGDIPRLNAKELAQHARSHAGRLLQASVIAEPTPLVDENTEFTGGIYLVGAYTDNASNLELLHKAFDKPDVEGYIGHIAFADSIGPDDWNHLMRRQLACPPNVTIVNGEVQPGSNKYGVGR
jgi:hypothetical protein